MTAEPIARSITLLPSLAEVALGRAFLAEIASQAGFSGERVFDITVACSEAMANAIEHSPVKGEVQVRAVLRSDRLEVEIQGPGEFQAPDRLRGRETRGLGLPLMAKLSDHLALFAGPNGETFVSLTFYRPGVPVKAEGAVAPTFANLAEENRLLDEVLKNFPDGFCVLDPDWRLIYVNPAVVRSLGRTSDELLGTVIWEAFPEREPVARAAFERARETGSTATLTTHNARGLWRETTAFPLAGGLAVISRDITRRVQAEEQLRERSQLLDLSFEPIFAWELDGPIVYWNRGAERLYGFSAAEAVDRASHELLHTVYPGGSDAFAAALKAREQWAGEVTRTTKDGRVLVVETRQEVISLDGRRLVLETNRDVTERKAAEEALRASQATLVAALESMTDAVFISDLEGRFIEFNEAFATFQKFRNKEECATTLAEYPEFLDVFLPSGEPVPLERWAVPRALRGEIASNAEYGLRRKDTGEAWIGSYNFSPIRDGQGRIVGSVVAARDITARKQAEERVRDLLEDERQLNEELATANEELRTQTEELAVQQEELRRLNADLKAGRERFQSVLDDSLDGLYRLDQNADSASPARRIDDPFELER